jgi:hypothetical protein
MITLWILLIVVIIMATQLWFATWLSTMRANRYEDAPFIMQRLAAYSATYEHWYEILEQRLVHFIGFVAIVHFIAEWLPSAPANREGRSPPSLPLFDTRGELSAPLNKLEVITSIILNILHIAAAMILICVEIRYLCKRIPETHEPDF